MARVAVVLFNLGGPDSPEAVRPFLANLFSDPAILRVPGVVRFVLSRLISRRRAPVAEEMYRRIGGRSPLREQTEDQATALEVALAGGDDEIATFVAMRYWHPLSIDAARRVKLFAPDRILLLPLYPQFSTSTSGSSMAAWRDAALSVGLATPTSAVCCYPALAGWIDALARFTAAGYAQASLHGIPRVLFSAHGLPKSFVERGDPYQNQVERTVAAVVERLGIAGLDHAICYQSRVGPLEWLGPYTDAEIRAAAAARQPIVVVPVAFVSEHSETLVELDMDYRKLALESGAPAYVRVPAVATDRGFIDGLAGLVRHVLKSGRILTSGADGAAPARICPPRFSGCPHGGS